MTSSLRSNLERVLATGLAACLLAPAAAGGSDVETPAPAGSEAAPAAAAPDAGADVDAVWRQRLDQARQRIGLARERESAARAAYSRARHDRNPRGDALAAIEEERQAAERELRAAEAALPELVEQARREGAPPAVLDPEGN